MGCLSLRIPMYHHYVNKSRKGYQETGPTTYQYYLPLRLQNKYSRLNPREIFQHLYKNNCDLYDIDIEKYIYNEVI